MEGNGLCAGRSFGWDVLAAFGALDASYGGDGAGAICLQPVAHLSAGWRQGAEEPGRNVLATAKSKTVLLLYEATWSSWAMRNGSGSVRFHGLGDLAIGGSMWGAVSDKIDLAKLHEYEYNRGIL